MSIRECPNHLKMMMSALKNEKQLCDVTIKVGKENIQAHRLVLVAASKYFRAMFFNDTKESKTGIVQFPGTPNDVVKQCIEFIYSGKVEFSLKNITDFMKTSDIIGLHNLTDLYVEFLSENVCLENVLGILSVAHLFKREKLNKSIQDFFLVNFNVFVKSKKYLSLGHDCFTHMLSLVDDSREMDTELKVIATMEWIRHDRDERKGHFVGLFHMINTSCVSNEIIKNHVMSESFVSGSKECMVVVAYSLLGGNQQSDTQSTVSCESSEGSNLHLQKPGTSGIDAKKQLKRKLEVSITSEKSDIKKSRFTRSSRYILTCNPVTKVVYRGDLKSDQWSRVTKLPVGDTSHLDIIEYRKSIFVGCGNRLLHFDGTVWKELWKHPTEKTPSYNRCVQIGECIYMVTTRFLVTYQLYTTESSPVYFKLSASLCFFLACSSEDIYIMGGGQYNATSNASVWSIKSDRQQTLSPMTYQRRSGVGVYYQDTVYAIGGGSESVEFLNSITEQWQTVKDLKIQCTGCKAHLADKLYIFGPIMSQESMIIVELAKLEVSREEKHPTRLNVGSGDAFCGSYR